MKVLFAVSNEKMSESIVRQYQKEYKQIISYKNVYYFNAILKELQRDKGYDRIVISEDLEEYVNTDYEQRDNFIFGRLDSISDEASNMNGEDIPIILLCTERRNKSEPILVKLFGIGIYNAIIGNDRSVNEVCRLINRPRSKKEAKIYYKIDTEDVSYEREDENDVSELEIQNILAHYKRLGNNEEKYVESFDSIASQYNNVQLRVISQCLPLNVRAVLEEKSARYQQVNSFNNKISDKVRLDKKQESKGTSEILLKNSNTTRLSQPVVVPSAIDASKKRKIVQKTALPETETIEEPEEEISLPGLEIDELSDIFDIQDDVEISNVPVIEEIPETVEVEEIPEEVEEQPVKRKRGRPRKTIDPNAEVKPKRGRGRPRKVVEEPIEENILQGLEEDDEDVVLPGFEVDIDNKAIEEYDEEEEAILPGFSLNDDIEDESEEETILPGFEENEIDNQYTNVLENLQKENNINEYNQFVQKEEPVQYPELDINSLLSPMQKLVAFVGTSKNGTSFLINNVAEILSANGIDTAILDLTQNRNAYYIYTKNEDELRNRSNYMMKDLKVGRANGIREHQNLTIYTTGIENDEDLQDVEPIVETLVRNHTVVLMDCDFTTPMRYFKYAKEIYLVQSMDILTIQPLTAFLRKLSDKGMFEEK